MTNMPAEPAPFWNFGITVVAICVPFFSLIGFLSTSFGYAIWVAKTKQVYRWLRPKRKPEAEKENEESFAPHLANRTMSTEEGMQLRMGGRAAPVNTRKERRESTRDGARESVSHPHIRAMVERMGEGRQSGLARMGTLAGSDADAPVESSKDTIVEVKD